MEKSNICVILTVPHAAGCAMKEYGHPCDTKGPRLAEIIAKTLHGYKIDVVGPLLGDIPRMIDYPYTDPNRAFSHGTQFRIDIKNWIIQKRYVEKKTVWIVDCHSFPTKDAFAVSEDTDFVLIDTPKNGFFSHYSSTLENMINNVPGNTEKEKIHAKLLSGPPVIRWGYNNDIIEESKKQGAKAFLLEVKETVPDAKIETVAKVISSFILNY